MLSHSFRITSWPLVTAAILLLTTTACQASAGSRLTSNEQILVGSTPGDSLVKAQLGIPTDVAVDFVRWKLALRPGADGQTAFALDLNFGLVQNNTLGFAGGGQHKSVSGTCHVSSLRGKPLYELRNDEAHLAVRLLQISEHLFHLLHPDDQLWVGNGGWSYTLNAAQPAANTPPTLPVSLAGLDWTTAAGGQEMVFEGRTACLDFADAYDLPVHDNCLKIKWKLTLRRDSASSESGTYTVRRILRQPTDLQGRWQVVKGANNQPAAVVIQLTPQQSTQPALSLLVVDGNVLFFLDSEQHLLVGNENFSYTLNRRP